MSSVGMIKNLLAEIRLTPPRRARRRIAGLVIPWMLSRKILRWRLAPPLPRPLPPLPPAEMGLSARVHATWEKMPWVVRIVEVEDRVTYGRGWALCCEVVPGPLEAITTLPQDTRRHPAGCGASSWVTARKR
jgi:hypothetical protein